MCCVSVVGDRSQSGEKAVTGKEKAAVLTYTVLYDKVGVKAAHFNIVKMGLSVFNVPDYMIVFNIPYFF